MRLVADLAEIVQAAHEAGVVHCDLKPDNVLVDARGQVRVLDFGLARALPAAGECAPATEAGLLQGTLSYMSPEQAAGAGAHVDARSDVYAIGTMLYELASDSLPLATRGVAVHEAVRALLEEVPRPLRAVQPAADRDLEVIARKALEKAPAQRYSSATVLADDLRRWLVDEPILAGDPSMLDTLRRLWARQRASIVWVAATLTLLLCGLAAALAFSRRSRAAETAAAREGEAIERLSDLRGVQVLTERAQALWPATPDRVPDLELWLREARAIAGRLEEHRALLSELRAGRCAALGADFPVARRAQALALQEELVAAVSAFAAAGGTLSELERRHGFASTLEQRTIGDLASAWAEASEAIAATPLYRQQRTGARLRIEPQVGLVPLGPDPESGLMEFAHVGSSGERARRDPGSGRIGLGEETGVVLVLIPGRAASGPGDAPAGPDSLRAVELDPFLLSKFELTQGQWLRTMGSNPSMWEAGTRLDDLSFDLRNPVEFISWDDAREALGRLDLEFPSEAQCVHAACAGASTRWPTGDQSESLQGAANLRSSEYFRRRNLPIPPEIEGLDDLWELHAHAGSLRPNAFGLHDTVGNVAEWCLDGAYDGWPGRRRGDGLVLTPEGPDRIHRGGSHTTAAREASTDGHLRANRGERGYDLGVRPARALRGFRFESRAPDEPAGTSVSSK
jgi:formylglycine-generating enzyme required for sulfatase activity